MLASGDPSVHLTLREVAPGVFVHTGSHVGTEHGDRADSANIGFIVGAKCVAVIDTGGSLATGRALPATIKQRVSKPICYVINTHIHFDHVLGNAAFAAPNIEFIGHHNLAIAMTANEIFFTEQFAIELERSGPEIIIGPTKTVAGEVMLDLGERNIVLRAHATADTNADLTVFDVQTSTLWTGDLVFIERLPILDGSLRGWLAWFDKVEAQSIARIVPGHGPASSIWPSGGEAAHVYLKALLNDGRKAIEDGIFLEDAMDSMSADAAVMWLVNDRHRSNVSKAYRELEWE